MKKILGIITARGGSKTIPRKNIKRLAGKPLIAWTIEAAQQSRVLNRVIVSTDDEKIAAIARKWEAEVPFLRPEKLAKDNTPTLPVLQHAVSFLKAKEGYLPDAIVLLQPTSPLRNAKHIRQAVSLLRKTKADSVVSVCLAKENPYWMMRFKGNRAHPFMTNGREYERRQDLPSAHFINGAIYVTRYSVLMGEHKILGRDTRAFVMDAKSSIDIDTSLDFKIAEALMKERQLATVKIAKNTIGEGMPCFVIAEAGINHNGSLLMAKRLVDQAKEAGADAVKFQVFKAKNVVSPQAPKAKYQMKNTPRKESQLEMLKRIELSQKSFRILYNYCKRKKILFLASPFDDEAIDFLDALGVAAFKIPSGEITNLPFLERIAGKRKLLIVSTGMSSLKEVKAAVKVIRKAGNNQMILLHCVSSYPAPVNHVNLRAMETLKKTFGLPVGFSDHTQGIEVALAAAALGACVIEKHFTLDRNLPGPDHQASLEPNEFEALVQGIRKVETSLGNDRKELQVSEANTATVARKSLIAARDIKTGTVLTEDLIAVKRPGTGLAPSMRSRLIGRVTRKPIRAGRLFAMEMVR